jgi:glutamate-1-semialdehyde 2,1-aminomutase
MDRHRFLPGGYGRSALAVGEVVPVAIRAEGPSIWGEGGWHLLDFNNNFASLIHGHAHPLIAGAAAKALTGGSAYGVSNEFELQHAATLVARLPHADMVRYTNSGTEAIMTAVRLARAVTGRSKLVILGGSYHGTYDGVLPSMGERASRGVPDAVINDTIQIPINDLDALEARIADATEKPAALLVDLLPNRLGMIPVSAEFIGRARNLCTEHGVILIIDEVISLRLGWFGLAGELKVRPDITVAGKLIGGGLPVGAVAGPESLMSEFNPLRPQALEHGGTFSSNPVSMAAGRAALELLTESEVERINALGDRLRKLLNPVAVGLEWEVRGRGSLVRVVAPAGSAGDPYRDLWWAAFNRGILITPSGLMTLSTAMTEEHVRTAAEAMSGAIAEAAEGGVAHQPTGA